MKNALTLEFLGTRTLLAATDDPEDCEFHGPDGSDGDSTECIFQKNTDGDNEGMCFEEGRSVLGWAGYIAARAGVTLVSVAQGIVEGSIVALPAIALIGGSEYALGHRIPDSVKIPAKIMAGLATYSLSLQGFDALLTQEEPTDPVLELLSPVKSLFEASESLTQAFHESAYLEVDAWAKPLQPRSIKNSYWAAATTVFSGVSGGFDYPHLELPERGEHGGDPCISICEC